MVQTIEYSLTKGRVRVLSFGAELFLPFSLPLRRNRRIGGGSFERDDNHEATPPRPPRILLACAALPGGRDRPRRLRLPGVVHRVRLCRLGAAHELPRARAPRRRFADRVRIRRLCGGRFRHPLRGSQRQPDPARDRDLEHGGRVARLGRSPGPGGRRGVHAVLRFGESRRHRRGGRLGAVRRRHPWRRIRRQLRFRRPDRLDRQRDLREGGGGRRQGRRRHPEDDGQRGRRQRRHGDHHRLHDAREHRQVLRLRLVQAQRERRQQRQRHARARRQPSGLEQRRRIPVAPGAGQATTRSRTASGATRRSPTRAACR